VFICVHPWLKQKPRRRVWQWGSINLVNESEPDRRAAQQQRVFKQPARIQITIHTGTITNRFSGSNGFFSNRRDYAFDNWGMGGDFGMVLAEVAAAIYERST
jgi:hypothetical protein